MVPLTTSQIDDVCSLVTWMNEAAAHGATRFELWQKPRGLEQRRVHASEPGVDAWNVADEFFEHVLRDRTLERGRVNYAVFACCGNEPPMERVFITPGMSEAMPTALVMHDASPSSGPAYAVTSLVASANQMTQGAFASLQKQNELLHKAIDTSLRTNAGSFETFAKGYERTFADLQARLEAALQESASLRAQVAQMEKEAKEQAERYSTLEHSRSVEEAEIARKSKFDDELVGQFKLLSPVVASKFLKMPIDGSLVAGPAFGQFLDSLTDPQIAQMLAPLSPPQQLVVSELIKTHRKNKAKAAAGGAATKPPASMAQGLGDGRASQGAASVPQQAAAPPDEATFASVYAWFQQHGEAFTAWSARKEAELDAAVAAQKEAKKRAEQTAAKSEKKGA